MTPEGRMIPRRLALSAALASLILAACGVSDEAAPRPRDEIGFSILSTENSADLEARWAPLLADMERQTGLEVRPVFAPDYALLVDALRKGDADAGWFSNLSGLEAVRRAGAEVFARTSDASGVDGYRPTVVVRADTPIGVEDLLACGKRHTFGMGEATSTSGALAPLTFLFAPREVEPRDCFKTVREANHEANLLSVAAGVLDAATSNTDALDRLAQTRPEARRKVRVVWEGPSLPEDPILWRKDLDPAAKEKIRSFFLSYGTAEGAEGERQRRVLASLDFAPFRPADDGHLLPVREMEAALAVQTAMNARSPEAERKARAELEALRRERTERELREGRMPPTPAG